jgi:hypothetical protein
MSALDRLGYLANHDTRFVYQKDKRAGAIVRRADGRFAAWSLTGKLGEYPDGAEAEKAVRAAQEPKR